MALSQFSQQRTVMQFGHSENSLHTLDLYSASVLQASLQPGFTPSQEFRALMQELAETSCEAYRSHVHFSDDFVRCSSASATQCCYLRASLRTLRPDLTMVNL